ncbi:MAG: deoxyribose-phosphate aldolase [Dialister sp.]|uniref:deoxyribose-phosphate aldolase n=2 Tax=Dialister TaxID=39948 RepID=UPI002E7958CE|nr:deoxyribose-phosphate aldolase [Dialister sp.]MEE0292176.1 deoxyribose-phosphate aldolase [Dialister sp.]
MTNDFIFSHVDHTLLKAAATWQDIRKLCEEAEQYHMASVCVPSSFVKKIRQHFPSLTICTVVGFPLGNGSTAAKVAETASAIADGADEIDMVIHIGALKEGNLSYVTDEIRQVKEAAGSHILKVIVETCYLTEEEKIAACRSVTEGGGDFIKTSTGFGSAGASLSDVKLFKKYVGPKVKIKAAGGIHSKKEMEDFLQAGASRIGASGAIPALLGKSI